MSPIPMKLRPGLIKERRIKLELDLRCEICGIQLHHTLLELHFIPPPDYGEAARFDDLEADILVLCPSCHCDVHRFGITEEVQRQILGFRSEDTRRRIRRILMEEIRPIPIPEQDLEESVRGAFPPHWGWGT